MKRFPPILKKSLGFCLALLFLISFQSQIIAQCDYPPGTITLNTAGGTTNTFYTTQYVLVNSDGEISQFQSTASFPNVTQGEYSAYAISYKTVDGINGLTIGQLFSGLSSPSNCLDISPAFAFSVGAIDAALAVSDTTICNPVQENVDLVITNAQNGVSYELQTLAGGSFSPAITGIGAGADLTLTIPQASAPTTTTSYKVVASLAGCSNTDLTDQPTVTVEGPLTISSQPIDSTICDLGNTRFAVVADGGIGTPSYQWQESTDGTTFNDITDGGIYSGATTATLNLTAATNAMNGYQYQVLISTGACNAITSAKATLTVEGTISYTTQPTDSDVCENDNTSFAAVVANESGTGTITYQWQESTDGITFNDITNGGIYSDATTATLSLDGVLIGMDGYQYQLVSKTGACSNITSSVVTLNVFNLPTATAGNDDNVCDDFGGFDLATLTTVPTSDYGTIQWTADNGNGTPNDEGAFSNGTVISPTYTPSTADIAAGSVTLTITVTGTNGSCTGQFATDNMVLTIDICCNATAPTLSGN